MTAQLQIEIIKKAYGTKLTRAFFQVVSVKMRTLFFRQS